MAGAMRRRCAQCSAMQQPAEPAAAALPWLPPRLEGSRPAAPRVTQRHPPLSPGALSLPLFVQFPSHFHPRGGLSHRPHHRQRRRAGAVVMSEQQ